MKNLNLRNSKIQFSIDENNMMINKLIDILKIDIREIQFNIIKNLIESSNNNLIKLLFNKFIKFSEDFYEDKMIIILDIILDELLKDRDDNIFLIILIEFYKKSIKEDYDNLSIDFYNYDELLILLDELLMIIHFDYDRELLIQLINNKEDNKEILYKIFE